MTDSTAVKTIPRVGVGVLVIKKENGKTYLMMHQRKGEHGPGYWGTGGGHLELGESLMEGALRELREEAGEQVKVKNVTFLGVVNFTQFEPKHYVDVTFLADWVSGEPTNSAPDETTDWQWVDIANPPSPLFPLIEKYLIALKTGEKFFDASFGEAAA